MGVPLPGLLSTLLLLLPASLRDHLLASHRHPASGPGGGLHPIVLIPGLSCSNLEAQLAAAYQPSTPGCHRLKREEWFGLWTNRTWMFNPEQAACFLELMRLDYDPDLNDFRNMPGVTTRVPDFGSPSHGFSSKTPDHPEYCLGGLRFALERLGYREGETLFGAPYDLRYAPPMPGQTSQSYSLYFSRLMSLIEDASTKNQGRPAIIFGHSLGGAVALEFVRNTPLPWRNKFIKHLLMVAPTWSGGYVSTLTHILWSPQDLLYIPSATRQSMLSMWRTLEIALANLPSPEVFGRKPLVITSQRNYSAYDIAELLVAIDSTNGLRAFTEREMAKMDYFEPPMVPMTYMNGVGTATAEQLFYWEDGFDNAPLVVYGDGDGIINLVSILAFEEKVGMQPGQRERFKSIKVDKVAHSALVTDEWSLKIIMDTIVEINR